MGAFLGISLWVALATIVPGLITIACVYGALAIVNPECLSQSLTFIETGNDWVLSGVAVTAMVLTQAAGILLEGFLTKHSWLGPDTEDIELPEGIDPHGETHIQLKPYFEYEGVYILLAELGENEDAQGHLKRALAQFFLTNNTLVSFGLGILTAGFAYVLCPTLPALWRFAGYAAVMGVCVFLSYKVAVIRFNVMAKSLWAARRRRGK